MTDQARRQFLRSGSLGLLAISLGGIELLLTPREALGVIERSVGKRYDPWVVEAFSALLRHVRSCDIPPTDTVVFLHTGGAPALFTRDFAARMETKP